MSEITPEKIQGWLDKYQRDCECFELYNNAPEIASLYMDLINSHIELNIFINKYCSRKQMVEFTGQNIIYNIMDAYLKLHEENQRLHNSINKYQRLLKSILETRGDEFSYETMRDEIREALKEVKEWQL